MCVYRFYILGRAADHVMMATIYLSILLGSVEAEIMLVWFGDRVIQRLRLAGATHVDCGDFYK